MTLYLGGTQHLKNVFSLSNLEPGYSMRKIEHLDGDFAIHHSVKTVKSDLIFSAIIDSVHREYLDGDQVEKYSKWFTKSASSFTTNNSWVFLNPHRFFTTAHTHATYRDFYRALSKHLFQERETILRTTLFMLHCNFPKSFVELKYGSKAERAESSRKIRPLAKTTYRDLRALLRPKDGPEEEVLTLCVSYYCRSTGYLKAVARAKTRIDIKGKFTEIPTASEILYALRVLKQREIHLPNVNNKINKGETDVA